MTLEPKIIFKDQLCGAKWRKKSLTCHKGTLKFTGQNVEDFWRYNAWCKECPKIRILDRKEFEENFKSFAKAVKKTLEEIRNE